MPTAKKASPAKKANPAKKREAASPDAIALLKSDHSEVKQLFDDYDELVESEADGEARQGLAENICAMLVAHTTIEEEIFYPAAREALDEQDLLDEADVEHASAKQLIEEIQSMAPDEALYDAKVKVLGEYVTHHVREEEGEMFPLVKKAKLDLKALGEAMSARKEELLEALETEDAS